MKKEIKTELPVFGENDLLVVKGLSKTFSGKSKTVYALNNVDNVIHKNERVVVIGPSGSGKSTFLRCLNRLDWKKI